MSRIQILYVTFLGLILSFQTASSKEKNVVALLDAGRYDEAIAYCDSSLHIDSNREDFYFFLARKADAYYYLGDIKNSLKFYLLSLEDEHILSEENRQALCETKSYAGFCYRELGLDQLARAYFTEALRISTILQDSVEMAIAHYNISTTLMSQGMLDEAMASLQNAYAIDLIRKDTAALGFDTKAMGEAFLVSGEPQRAIPLFSESINLLKKSKGNYSSLGIRYEALSRAYRMLAKYDSALYYLEKSIFEHEKYKDSVNLAERWVSLSSLYNELDQTKEALLWAQKARKFFSQGEYGSQHILANEALIRIYLTTNEEKKADELIAENINLSQSLNLLLSHRVALMFAVEMYEHQGEFQKAIATLKEVNLLQDSIQKMDAQKARERMQVRYETDKISNENVRLLAEKEIDALRESRLRYQLTAAIVIALLLLLLIWGFYFFRLRKTKMERLLQEQEYEALQARYIETLNGSKTYDLIMGLEALNAKLVNPLTEREYEVLKSGLKGHGNKMIAEELYVSESTVKFHLRNIYNKFGVANRKEALEYVVKTS